MAALGAKLDEVMKRIGKKDASVAALSAKINEVKQSIETRDASMAAQGAKLDNLETAVRALSKQIQELKPWQGSPTCSMRSGKGMRTSWSESKLPVRVGNEQAPGQAESSSGIGDLASDP